MQSESIVRNESESLDKAVLFLMIKKLFSLFIHQSNIAKKFTKPFQISLYYNENNLLVLHLRDDF